MCYLLASAFSGLAATGLVAGVLATAWPILLIILGFSAVIFVHELGHFLVAKWCDVRVEKFAIGFFREVFGFTRGETRYSFNILPLGGYVKMLGQEDFDIDKSGELRVKGDLRSFSNKSVGRRMLIVSAGVVMNVVFAGVLFMIVFMMGKQGQSTEVGYVKPNWPAALAGIEPGDVIERVDGREIEEFHELNFVIMLAAPLEPLDFNVRRQGRIKHLKVTPLNNEAEGLLQIGVGPAVTRTIGAVGPSFDPDREDHLRIDDVVVELNGREVTEENANEMMYRLISTPFDVKDVVVERAVSAEPGAETKRLRVHLPVQLGIYPSDPSDRDSLHAHVLGLAPLTKVASVEEGGRAYLGGLEVGDVVLRWGEWWYPTYGNIIKSIRQNGERDIPVIVERKGKQAHLTIRPKVKRRLVRADGKPRIGAVLNVYATELLRIGAVVDAADEERSPAALSGIPQGALITHVNGEPVETWLDLIDRFRVYAAELLGIGAVVDAADGERSPAALSGIPRGALITHVNGEPVTTWIELIDRFRAHAGSAVTLTYNHNRDTGLTCRFEVPHSIRTILGLEPHVRIIAIDGEENIRVDIAGRSRNVAVSSPFGLHEMLKTKVGRTVTVTYAESPFAEGRTAELTVTEGMVDPWLCRILYYTDVRPVQATKIIKKGPVGAIELGVKKTIYFIASVYSTMQRMIFSRSVGIENLSGPIGIVKIGRAVAEIGVVELLFFLAMISANLAVLNFLPLPIVDGGLMVFLLIEKVKGSPVNLKIQMATQVIGLILIGMAFVFVTIQDLSR